ncbi:MAG TPA: asparagine synthase (glutamine-hydrolyzing) [Methylomirabilota bacterium]|nr:asparagine synthase (glutamine-hydrolyzing) [Methylomirabilota bacterium]
MCGIAGILRRDGAPVDEALLGAMTSVLAHRGPDGQGVWARGPVGIGHRRLAIIDLVTGDQPMFSADGEVAVIFNGEIYNYRELRRELEAQGHRFTTTSDTEVLLRAYEAHGQDCLGRLRGMFAFALWDGRRRRLLLARDRVGIKPMVYTWDGRRLLYASELKSLLQDPSVPRDVDWEAFGDYLTYHYVPSPRTIFRAIRKLPPASLLVLDLEGGEPRIERYWDLEFKPDERRSEADWSAQLRVELQDAVRSHLVSDVPIGAFLSGGLDSSTVVAMMAHGGASPLRTFSIGFGESDYDELKWASLMAQRYGTDHYEFVVKPEALDVLPQLAWQFDEPFADSSALPTYYVAKITREHVTVALSGDGGDENFAGYRRYARAQALHEQLDAMPGRLARSLFRAAGRLLPPGARGQRYAELRGEAPLDRYFRMMTAHRSRSVGRLLTAETRRRLGADHRMEAFRAIGEAGRAPDYVSTLQYLDVRTYLPEDILTKVDRTSMLVSLEARVPLLDHRLMEFVATMPSRFKLRDGLGKRILRDTVAPDLPPELLQRGKMGFGVPLDAWFRGELQGYARDVLLGPRARQRGWLEPSAVGRLLDEHRAGTRDHASQIWSLLCLEEWARRWLDRA